MLGGHNMGTKLMKPINSTSFRIKLKIEALEAFQIAINREILKLQDIGSGELGKKLLLDQLCNIDEKIHKIAYWSKPEYTFTINRSQALTLMILFNGFQSNDTYQDNTIRKVLNPINQILL